jgi:hypothetical protein
MEDFRNSALNNKFGTTLVIGGTFGVFLTLGYAWSDFLKEAIVSLLPENDQLVLQSFIYAMSASVVCIFVLFCVVKFDNYTQKIKFKTPIFSRKYTNSKPETKDVKSTKQIIYPLKQATKRRYKSRKDIKK